MDTDNKYKTLSAPAIGEFKDRGSKFLSFAYPVKSVDEIKVHVKTLKSEHPKAVHHCVAWRLGYDGSQHRASDDGEPAGSAGRPMLGAIDSAGLTNVLVVVVRYFGGTLLGVPGLIHAYRHVTELAINSVPLTEHWIEKDVAIECDYANMGEVLYVLRKHEASIHEQDMQLFCTIHAGIPLHTLGSCLQKLSEIRGVSCR
jgi:uncharacterized YigZ family protein